MYCHHKRVFTIDTNVLLETAIIQCSLWGHIVAFKDYSLQWFRHRYKKDGECIHVDIADWKRVGYGNGNDISEHTCTHAHTVNNHSLGLHLLIFGHLQQPSPSPKFLWSIIDSQRTN